MKFNELYENVMNEGKVTIDVDFVVDDQKATDKLLKKHKVTAKITGDTTADLTGEKKNLIAYLKAGGYVDLEELYPELF
jgi:hypothetical protein